MTRRAARKGSKTPRPTTLTNPEGAVTSRQAWFTMILLNVGKAGFESFVPGWDDDDIEEGVKPSAHAANLLTESGVTRGDMAEIITALNDAKKAAKGKGPRSKAVKALKELRVVTIQTLMAVVGNDDEIEDEYVSDDETHLGIEDNEAPVDWASLASEAPALDMEKVAFFLANLTPSERLAMMRRILSAKGM